MPNLFKLTRKKSWKPTPIPKEEGLCWSLKDPSSEDGVPFISCRIKKGRNKPRWLFFTGVADPVMVNGFPWLTGMRELRDRDEILFPGGERFLFSSESPVLVQPFPGVGRRVTCPRCTRSIVETKEQAVQCPSCGVWHHQDEAQELLCWTYAEGCASCGHTTAMDAADFWTPACL